MPTQNILHQPAKTINLTEHFAELNQLKQRLDRLFDEWWPSFRKPEAPSGGFPLISLRENRDHYILEAEVPGVKAEDLKVQTTTSRVIISGERKTANPDENVSYHCKEREGGKFSRAIDLSGEFDPDKIEASLRNGVLTMRLPKTEATKSRQIPIKAA